MADEKHTQHKEVDDHSGVETTGHSWDGIKELNNPLPRWWLISWYICIIASVIYMVFMPSWPGINGYLKGTRNHSERQNVDLAMATIETERSALLQQLLTVSSIQDIENDPDLLTFAMTAGKSMFGDNCATCHAAGGQGTTGYPNLIDDDWLWGGSLDQIQTTLHYGIRSTHADTRINLMQAYGRDRILTSDQISDLVEYVVSLSGREANTKAIERAKPIFAQNCTSCHGVDGTGIQAQGAPNLSDAIWLFGGDRVSIQQTIFHGRSGVMPAWTDRLSDEQIVALAVYVHSLGGGE